MACNAGGRKIPASANNSRNRAISRCILFVNQNPRREASIEQPAEITQGRVYKRETDRPRTQARPRILAHHHRPPTNRNRQSLKNSGGLPSKACPTIEVSIRPGRVRERTATGGDTGRQSEKLAAKPQSSGCQRYGRGGSPDAGDFENTALPTVRWYVRPTCVGDHTPVQDQQYSALMRRVLGRWEPDAPIATR